MKTILVSIGFAIAVGVMGGVNAASVVDDLIAGYERAGGPVNDARWAEGMWTKKFPAPKEEPGPERSCSTCHTTDLKTQGKHASTGKVIDPLAPSVNKDRLTDVKTIEKWFKRNCIWVLGRECTPQEKSGFLQFIRNQ